MTWHTTPEAQALLASCAGNPPAYVTRILASHERWTRDDESVSGYDPNDGRVDALAIMSNRAQGVAMQAYGDDKAALRKAYRNWPHVDHVIAKAIERAGRKVAA